MSRQENACLSYMSPKCLLIESYTEASFFVVKTTAFAPQMSSLNFFTEGIQNDLLVWLFEGLQKARICRVALPVTRYLAVTLTKGTDFSHKKQNDV